MLRAGGRLFLGDVRHTGRYIQVLPECGVEDLRRRVESVPSQLIGAISFGFAYPANVTARKPVPAGGQEALLVKRQLNGHVSLPLIRPVPFDCPYSGEFDRFSGCLVKGLANRPAFARSTFRPTQAQIGEQKYRTTLYIAGRLDKVRL